MPSKERKKQPPRKQLNKLVAKPRSYANARNGKPNTKLKPPCGGIKKPSSRLRRPN